MGKGEIARYEQFLLFPQCFQKDSFPGVPKGIIEWEWVICFVSEKRFQKELQFRMVGAIENADTKLLESLILSGVDPNARILLVKTPLTHALDQDEVCLEIVTTLLEGGADPNLSDFTPRCLAPLHVVALKGNLDAAEIIFNRSKNFNCDIEIRDRGGCTPLHFAARFGRLEMVQYLLKQSADIDSKDFTGCTALHRACEYPHFEVAKYLLESGHCVNARDNFNWTPLFYSVFFVHTLMVKLLLQYGADLSALDSHNNSVLSAVCFCQHSAVDFFPVQRIVSTSFDYYERTWAIPPQNLKDHLRHDDAYFLWDSDTRRLELLKVLINTGADPNLYRTDGMALMDYGGYSLISYPYFKQSCINPLPYDKMLDWSKLKQIADNIL